MIYLDNAATTFPKPLYVRRAANDAMTNFGANPGRSGHAMALKASEEIYNARSKAAEFFNEENPENVIFTLNCTHAINMVLKGLLSPGDHVVVSDMEHNAVMRPLSALADRGVAYSTARVSDCDPEETLSNFREALRPNTKLVVCIHVSNVWGIKLPIERITAMCHQYGIPVLVDASQSAGSHKIDIGENKFDFVCMPGHKGLYGPMGTGILITSKHDMLKTIIEGGTGSGSVSMQQPLTPPDKFESGTPNLSGIVGLGKGIDFVRSVSSEKILSHEITLMAHLYDRLSSIPSVILYAPKPSIETGGTLLSFNVKDTDSETVAAYLNKNYGIAVRAGLHCAPMAHKHYGTLEQGAVRISPSYFTTVKDINTLATAISRMPARAGSTGVRRKQTAY